MISDTIAAAVNAAHAATDSEAVDINPHIRRILEAAGEYADHRTDTVTQFAAGPALIYVHTDGKTVSAVDRAPVDHSTTFYDNGSRERAISRALITEALRLLNDSEQS